MASWSRRLSPDESGWTDRYAGLIGRVRWLLVLGWIAAAALTTMLLPQVSTSSSSDPTAVLPANSAALAAQLRSLADFAIPNVSTTIVVVSDPAGLDPFVQADTVLWALSYDQRLAHESPPYPNNQVLGALPLLNGVPLASGGRVTTAVTYLYFSPSTGASTQTRLARQYASHFDGLPGVRSDVTGVAPATVATGAYVGSSLPRMTLATLVFVALIVGITFRSAVAPIVTLGAAGVAYLVDLRVLGAIGRVTGLSLPSELDPIVVALLLGIITDYTVLFLSALRDGLGTGVDRSTAIRQAIVNNVSIVAVAGLTVAAGTAALEVSSSSLFRSFGPGLAITVVVGLSVSATLIPALMALLGPAMFWPSRPHRLAERADHTGGRRTSRWVQAVTSRRSAAVTAVGCLAALAIACLPLAGTRLGLSFVGALPSQDPVHVGAQAAAAGYAPGIIAPTEVLIESPGIASRRLPLAALQQQAAREPGVADVLGVGDDPLLQAHGLLLSDSGSAARMFVVFGNDPLGAAAIADLHRLQEDMPHLARRAGLGHARLEFAGQTAIAAEAAQLTSHNLELILLTAFGVEFVLLAAYLRALVAPLVLLIASALVVGASVGLATLVFGGGNGLTFYAPFASAVLLVALGSDYNVFAVGGIWEEAGRRPLIPALRAALPRTARAITTAGLTLAGSFALVAVVPLAPFREIAFMMAVGLLLDTFLVRSLFTPSIITLLGPAAGWPGRRLRRPRLDESSWVGRPTALIAPPVGSASTSARAPTPTARRSRGPGTGSPVTGLPTGSDSHTGGAPSMSEAPAEPTEPTAAGLAIRRRWRGRLRPTIRVLVAAALLAGVVWGADAAVRVGAQSAVARAVQRAERLGSTPTVTVHGSFFLPQAIRGRYSDVDITIEGLRDGALRIDQLTAHLQGVHVALGPVITGDVPGIPIDRTQERVSASYADLNRYLAAQGDPITVSAGPNQTLQLTGHVTVFGKDVALSADTRFEPMADGIHVTPVKLDTGTAVLDALSRLTLGERVSFVIPTQLPFGQHVDSVTAGPADVQVLASGKDVVVTTARHGHGGGTS